MRYIVIALMLVGCGTEPEVDEIEDKDEEITYPHQVGNWTLETPYRAEFTGAQEQAGKASYSVNQTAGDTMIIDSPDHHAITLEGNQEWKSAGEPGWEGQFYLTIVDETITEETLEQKEGMVYAKIELAETKPDSLQGLHMWSSGDFGIGQYGVKSGYNEMYLDSVTITYGCDPDRLVPGDLFRYHIYWKTDDELLRSYHLQEEGMIDVIQHISCHDV